MTINAITCICKTGNVIIAYVVEVKRSNKIPKLELSQVRVYATV